VEAIIDNRPTIVIRVLLLALVSEALVVNSPHLGAERMITFHHGNHRPDERHVLSAPMVVQFHHSAPSHRKPQGSAHLVQPHRQPMA